MAATALDNGMALPAFSTVGAKAHKPERNIRFMSLFNALGEGFQ
jgi:hypothetical protein